MSKQREYSRLVAVTMSDIRAITAAEVPLLLPLARAFMAEGNIDGKLDERHFVANLQAHLERGTGFVFVAEPLRGMICGIMFPDMATAEICCMEFFWYVDSHERGSIGMRLLQALEDEAARRKAVRIYMGHMVTDKSETFARLFGRRGYRMKEQVFIKEVHSACAA